MEGHQEIMDPGNFSYSYCPSLTEYSRRKTRVVKVGDIPLGEGYPVRLQTMTNTPTLNTHACVEQCIRIAGSGADYVRLTVQNIKEAENLANIKKELRRHRVLIPLIADIHFNPGLAEKAAGIVEKVRINPGNFVPQDPSSRVSTFTEDIFLQGLSKIRDRLVPLLQICRDHGTALRIGVNHGSLSNRIMDRYGDTPLGMVISAMEFVSICTEEHFHQVVLSMKSSNPLIMVQACRLLVNRLDEKGWNYPLHLGVTEAGEGEEGRIKSAVGIGTLLSDGIGDTVRISLTEDPENEIPVARRLVDHFSGREGHESIEPVTGNPVNPYVFSKRETNPVMNIGGGKPPVVVADFSTSTYGSRELLTAAGFLYDGKNRNWTATDQAADYIFLGDHMPENALPGIPGYIINYRILKKSGIHPGNLYPLYTPDEYFSRERNSRGTGFLRLDLPLPDNNIIDLLIDEHQRSEEGRWPVLVLSTQNIHGFAEQRAFVFTLMGRGCAAPVIFFRKYPETDPECFQLKSSCDLGGLFIDGLGDGIWLSGQHPLPAGRIISSSFGILQACRARITKPEYISCPSCGRTLFNLPEVTARIRQATSHLKGLKIGIMGCVVNGPGEMADADYGYVGSGPGKVTLYKGKNVIKRGIPAENAVGELIELIRTSGHWTDPEEKRTLSGDT